MCTHCDEPGELDDRVQVDETGGAAAGAPGAAEHITSWRGSNKHSRPNGNATRIPSRANALTHNTQLNERMSHRVTRLTGKAGVRDVTLHELADRPPLPSCESFCL